LKENHLSVNTTLQETTRIKQQGFNGKSLINPRQTGLLPNLYAPKQKEADRTSPVSSLQNFPVSVKNKANTMT